MCHGQIHLLSLLTELVSRYATCAEKLAKTNKSNIERHFQSKQTAFTDKKYAAGDERRKVISES